MKYLTVDQVIALHDSILKSFGGLPGIRDRGLLESDIANPRANMFGQEMYPTVFDKAASYLFSIARNHSFLDANKRTAASAALLFLRINGKNFDYDSDEFVNFVLDVAQGFKDINQISKHLESLWKKEQISESFKKAKKIKK